LDLLIHQFLPTILPDDARNPPLFETGSLVGLYRTSGPGWCS